MKRREPPPLRDYTDAVEFPETVSLRAIAVARTPHSERHGTPRQPGLAGRDRPGPDEPSQIVFSEDIPPEALADLAGFDRIWVIAWFHLNGPGWPKRVRPPRGGPKRSLLATRAPHRPNPIGLSAVKLEAVEGRVLHVRGLDLIDGTPILDVKPYVPFADAFPDAEAGWVDATGGRPESG